MTKRIGTRGILGSLCVVACFALAVGLWQWWNAGSAPAAGAASEPTEASEPATNLLPTAPDRPDIRITPDHRLAQVRHKDASGLSPYETVETPEGTVTIRRTFGQDGELLEEKAERDGKPVPIPRPE